MFVSKVNPTGKGGNFFFRFPSKGKRAERVYPKLIARLKPKLYVLLHFPLTLAFNSMLFKSALPLTVAFLKALEAANYNDFNLELSSS